MVTICSGSPLYHFFKYTYILATSSCWLVRMGHAQANKLVHVGKNMFKKGLCTYILQYCLLLFCHNDSHSSAIISLGTLRLDCVVEGELTP